MLLSDILFILVVEFSFVILKMRFFVLGVDRKFGFAKISMTSSI